ncbi:hypothetical protein BDQ17DRAFT_1333235 [Cyathus striatus]|nr:hypothetical protein BDQ17DRAFT_1333235 [Cyathus striatus]
MVGGWDVKVGGGMSGGYNVEDKMGDSTAMVARVIMHMPPPEEVRRGKGGKLACWAEGRWAIEEVRQGGRGKPRGKGEARRECEGGKEEDGVEVGDVEAGGIVAVANQTIWLHRHCDTGEEGSGGVDDMASMLFCIVVSRPQARRHGIDAVLASGVIHRGEQRGVIHGGEWRWRVDDMRRRCGIDTFLPMGSYMGENGGLYTGENRGGGWMRWCRRCGIDTVLASGVVHKREWRWG